MADRVAVITGAGSGIGRASALALCKDGWSVALLGRRKDALEETAGLATGGKTLPIPTDVAEPDQVIAAFATVKEKWAAWTCCSTTPEATCRRRTSAI